MKNIVLRNRPLIEVSIRPNAFVLKDEDNPQDNGIYEFNEIDSLRIEKRVNWLVSLTSVIVSLISSTGGDIYKERDQLKFNYRNRPKTISLKGGNLNLAVKTVNEINQKINTKA